MASNSLRMKKSIASTGKITIPSEIITEILHRLPTKSVGRFRCVSKDWLCQLSSPQFIKTHQKTLNENHIIFVCIDGSLYSFPFNYDESVSKPTKLQVESDHVYFNVHGSCDGLVLVSSHDDDVFYKLVVLNPTTREFTEIPDGYSDIKHSVIKRDLTCGFGYDSLTDDYKIVRIDSYPIDDNSMGVRVYSLRTNTWTRVIDAPYYDLSTSTGVFVNGFLHWFANKGSDKVPIILAFSLSDEKLVEVPSPGVDILYCKLVAFGGKLGIFLKEEGEIWLMNEYGVKESWTKIIIHGFDKIYLFFRRPMIFDYIGKILVADQNLALIYDIEERRFSKIVGVSLNEGRNGAITIIKGCYAESLVSPKLIRTHQKSVISSKGCEELEMVNEAGEKNP